MYGNVPKRQYFVCGSVHESGAVKKNDCFLCFLMSSFVNVKENNHKDFFICVRCSATK